MGEHSPSESGPVVSEVVPPTASSVTNDSAYFVLETGALVRFDGVDAVRLAVTGARDVFIGPDDAVYVLEDHALAKISGDVRTEIVSLADAAIAPVHSAAIGPDGAVWVAGRKGVATREGDAWQLTPLADLGLDPALEPSVVFDSAGVVWVVDDVHASYRQADRWVPAPVSMLEAGYVFGHPQSSRVGRVHVANHHRITRLGTRDFDSVLVDYRDRRSFTADLDVNAQGYAASATASCDVVRTTPVPPTLLWELSAGSCACKTLEAIALDSRLRLWIASQEGLSVIEDDLRVREFPRSSLPALDARVHDMVVVGPGPTLE